MNLDIGVTMTNHGSRVVPRTERLSAPKLSFVEVPGRAALARRLLLSPLHAMRKTLPSLYGMHWDRTEMLHCRLTFDIEKQNIHSRQVQLASYAR